MKKFLISDGIALYSDLDDSYLNLHRKCHRIIHSPKKEPIFFLKMMSTHSASYSQHCSCNFTYTLCVYACVCVLSHAQLFETL